ncbi:hypothetical protein AXG93_3678s1090 [Marchantia polymorpha subsp. ruderalis]|uniref:Uncharacterized protein n=1 Tax=Marchantia polymorpha subsp. ruderalis TaxID=1480154 RepID=A0A176W9L7_MARPO|nr:hypothetical protein AXG93_3678s1090 [Marchantia polymorpha subsp. ruderalis]
MKARRLILDDDGSAKSRRTVRKDYSSQEARSVEKAVLPLLQYLNRKWEKYAEGNLSESYVEIVRNRTRVKREVALEVAAKERRSQPTEAKYQALQRKLRGDGRRSKPVMTDKYQNGA